MVPVLENASRSTGDDTNRRERNRVERAVKLGTLANAAAD